MTPALLLRLTPPQARALTRSSCSSQRLRWCSRSLLAPVLMLL